jgi:hypothetical protein
MTTPSLKLLTATELLALPAPDPCDPELWGGWIADFRLGVFYHAGEDYEIDLDRCLTAGAVLDWIIQVAEKAWASPPILAGLVRLVDHVLRPQAGLCRGRDLCLGWWRDRVAHDAEGAWN